MARDFYEILGLPRTATQDDIRAAHRKLVRKFHPDANKHDPQADKKFQEVQEAYDTLSDPPKRRQYDQFGGRQPGPDPAWRPRHAEPPPDFEDDAGYEGMFEQLFGSKGPFGRGRRREAQDPDADVEYPITLTLAQAARGTSLPVNINRGSRTDSIEVKIPAGVKTGSRIRVRGKGARGSFGPGDLYIVVNVAEHPYFRRDGLDILLDVPVSAYEAMLGTQITVPTIDGPETISIPAGINSGTKMRLRNHGIRQGEETGDQLVVIKIIMPKDLPTEARLLVEQLARLHPIDPGRTYRG